MRWVVLLQVLLYVLLTPSVHGICLSPPPQFPNRVGWQKSSIPRTIRYFVDNRQNTFTPDERTEIRAAFTLWSSASLSTCIKVNFDESQTSAGALYLVIFSSSSGTTTTTQVVHPVTRITASAGTIIKMDDFNRGGENYVGMIKKAMLHEIGHTFGLGENYGGASQSSVMQAKVV